MKNRHRFTLCALLFVSFLLALFVGCGGSEEPAAENAAANDNQPAPQQEELTADAAVQAIFDGLKQNKPVVAWEALPASYQNDVNTIVRDFAGKMDAELWNHTFGTLKKLLDVLKNQQNFILGNKTVQMLTAGLGKPAAESPSQAGATPSQGASAESNSKEDQAKNIRTASNAILDLLNILVSSELSDLNKLKEFDGKTFLSGTGGKFMTKVAEVAALDPKSRKEYQKAFAGTVSIARTEGETVFLKLEKPGQPGGEIEAFVKVEDKWIPKEMADGWKRNIEQAKAKVAELSQQQITQQKDQVLEGLDQADEVLTKLSEAKSQGEFDQVLSPIASQAMMMAGLFGGMGAGGPMPPGGELGSSQTFQTKTPTTESGGAIEVQITGDVEVETLIAADENLKKTAKLPDDYQFVQTNEGEIWKLRFKSDVPIEVLARGITFGKVTKVDAEAGVITVEAGKQE